MKKISLLALLCSLMLLFAACATEEPITPGTDTGGETTGETTDGTDDGEDTAGTTTGATTGATGGTGETGGTTGETGGTTTGETGGEEPPPTPVAGICATAETPAAETDVVFGDERVEAAAKQNLDDLGIVVGADEAISCEDIVQVLGVTVRGEALGNGIPNAESNLDTLAGLENATSLTTIEVNTQRLSDLTPLAGLTSLTEVVLPNNQINDLSALTGLDNLTKVFVAFNRTLTDVSVLTAKDWPGETDDVRLQGTRVTDEDAEALVTAGVETVQLADGSFIGPVPPNDGGGAAAGGDDGGAAAGGDDGGAAAGGDDGDL